MDVYVRHSRLSRARARISINSAPGKDRINYALDLIECEDEHRGRPRQSHETPESRMISYLRSARKTRIRRAHISSFIHADGNTAFESN